MKKFLITIASFGVLLLLMCIIIEVALLFRPNIYAYKKHYMDQHYREIKVLLLGSSHIEEAVKPELIGKGTFNLAISARLVEYDAALAEMYVSKMDCLQVLVMSIDYTNFFFERQYFNPKSTHVGENLSTTCRCMHTKYMGMREDPFWYWSEIFNSKLNYMSRFWNSNEKLQECDSLGYVKLEIENRLPDWEYKAIPALVDTSKTIDSEAYAHIWDIYERLAKQAQKKGARLILITPPVYKTYQEAINPIVLNDMHQFAEKLHAKYPCVEYHEYLFNDNFLPDDFNDSSHLTESGAIKFSKMLSNIINNDVKEKSHSMAHIRKLSSNIQ